MRAAPCNLSFVVDIDRIKVFNNDKNREPIVYFLYYEMRYNELTIRTMMIHLPNRS